jgi:hypothetical protein
MMSGNENEPDKPLNLLRLISVLSVVAFAILVIAMCWSDKQMISRDIGCTKAPTNRGREICNAISASMEWTWMGHAIVSPGWRTTRPGIAKVYCREHITATDLPVLASFKGGLDDWRLESGAEELTYLVNNADGKGDAPENSIFNPKNPSYVLKGGCR